MRLLLGDVLDKCFEYQEIMLVLRLYLFTSCNSMVRVRCCFDDCFYCLEHIEMIPFERYRWIANSFASRAWEHAEFIKMICDLVNVNVPTVIVEGPRVLIVVTWQRAANA